MSRHPEIVWAQRSDKLFLTVELPDAKNPRIKLEPEGKLCFSATVGPEDILYEANVEFCNKVNVEASKISVGSRHTLCIIEKAEKEWWPRLLKQEGKAPPYLKVDWNKWVDEDEEKDSTFDNFDLGGMDDFSKYGMGGEEAESDDEDLPELEKAS